MLGCMLGGHARNLHRENPGRFHEILGNSKEIKKLQESPFRGGHGGPAALPPEKSLLELLEAILAYSTY